MTEDDRTLGGLVAVQPRSTVAAIVVLLLSAGAFVVSWIVWSREESPVVASFGFLFGVLSLLFGLGALTVRLEIREHGLRRTGLFGSRTLPFADIVRFRYHRQATAASLELLPATGRAFHVNGTFPPYTQNTWFIDLQDRLVTSVKNELRRRMESEGSVEWFAPAGGGRFPEVRMTKDTLIVSDRKESPVPLAHVSADVSDGQLRVFAEGRRRPLFECDPSLPNVYPGLRLLQELQAELGKG